VIKSFSDQVTEKVFLAENLTNKERRSFGQLNVEKAYQRLFILNRSEERDLMMIPSFHYHSLNDGRYSIDADKRNSPWRITFRWVDDELSDVELVKIEDTH